MCRRCWYQVIQFHFYQIEDNDVVTQSTAKQERHDEGMDYNALCSIRTLQGGTTWQRSKSISH
jgi:hypothetical protein